MGRKYYLYMEKDRKFIIRPSGTTVYYYDMYKNGGHNGWGWRHASHLTLEDLAGPIPVSLLYLSLHKIKEISKVNKVGADK